MRRKIKVYSLAHARLREKFIQYMTTDSETQDRRRSEFHQAIFSVESDEAVDAWNAECEKYGLSKKQYGCTVPVWDTIDMDMVLDCFDKAVRAYEAEEEARAACGIGHAHARNGF